MSKNNVVKIKIFKENINSQINLVEFKQLDEINCTYETIMSGFKTLKVVTYSLGLKFAVSLLDYFDDIEIIIGAQRMVRGDVNYAFAYQEHSLKAIKNLIQDENLRKALEENRIHFYVSDLILSHEKVYLLEGNGKQRVMLGSANLSSQAWSGGQIENIVFSNDLHTFQYWNHKYETLRDLSSCYIPKKTIVKKETTIEDLPIIKKVIETNQAIVLTEAKEKEEVEYYINLDKTSKDYEKLLNGIHLNRKDGLIYVTPDKVKEIKTNEAQIKKESKLRIGLHPKFEVDYTNNRFLLNDKELNMNPDPNKVVNDINLILEYMNGFKQFSNDTHRMKTEYWKVLNWMFCSVFMGRFTYICERYDIDYPALYPMFCLIYGPSNGGKTKFVRMVEKLMFGFSYPKLKGDYFKVNSVLQLQTENKGIPILIDDLTGNNFRSVENIVKTPYNFTEEEYNNMPCIVLTGNKINTTKNEVSKRVFCCYIDNGINKSEAAKNVRKVSALCKDMTSSFYSEYLKRMLPEFLDLCNQVKYPKDDSWYPDILKTSAKVIDQIFTDFNIKKIDGWMIFDHDHYMGDKHTSRKAKRIITEQWKRNPEWFTIDKKADELIIDFSKEGYSANKEMDILINELPATLECKKQGNKIVLRYSQVVEFTGLNFRKKNLLERMFT